jgi:acid phosphatase
MRTYPLFIFFSLSYALQAQLPTPEHVVVVVFENRSYSQIFEDPKFVPPFINSLAKDPTCGALFTQSFGITHPSQPNYLHLFSGSDQGITGNETPKSAPFVTPNLGASLLQTGKTFVGYSEDLPHIGFLGDSTVSAKTKLALYTRKHSPWVNWQDAGMNGIPASLNQPFSNFPSDYSKLPTISLVIPNLDHDMHNQGRTAADDWLRANLSSFVQWAKTNNSLLIITFDEDDSSKGNKNRIATIFFGPMVKPGLYNETPNGITHHHVLRTLEDIYGLPHCGNAAFVKPITDCWVSIISNRNIVVHTKKELDGLKLSWSAESQVPYDFFVIENSTNGVDFEVVETIMVSRAGQSEQGYGYLHKNPLKGKSFYRLKLADLEGKYTYSEIVSTEF